MMIREVRQGKLQNVGGLREAELCSKDMPRNELGKTTVHDSDSLPSIKDVREGSDIIGKHRIIIVITTPIRHIS
jgi:hypothetical protein